MRLKYFKRACSRSIYLTTILHQVVEEPGPTKQRVMCGGRGAWELIRDHPDMEARGRRAETSRAPPRLDLVLSPPPTTVLVMEITASMTENQDWKHINKATHNLIKYDLPDTARLAVVSFANTSRVEAGVTQLRGSRGHLADIVPDKFRLDTGGGEARCVACGVSTAVTEVLGEGRAGAHLILVTRAGPDTLSPTEMATLREYVEYYQVTIKIRVFWEIIMLVTFPACCYLTLYILPSCFKLHANHFCQSTPK